MRLPSILVVIGLVVGMGPAFAQGVGAEDPSNAVPDYNPNLGRGVMTQGQANQLRNYVSNAAMANGTIRPGSTSDQDKKDAYDLAGQLKLPCTVEKVALAGVQPSPVNPKEFLSKTYEVTCSNGLGYFLISQSKAPPEAISCFEAEAARDADLAAGRQPGITCQLAGNGKAVAGAALTHAGTACTVAQLRWMGESAKNSTEYTEIACSDGKGYVLASALPGSEFSPRVTSCHDAALKGVFCKLTDPGVSVITVATFKNALAQHGVSCDASDVRVIGKENVEKRHVVEFQCPQHPKGLVAYIPLSDSKAPFEALDCAQAAKRRVVCKLTKAD